jgi:carboxymethylenebutenolidase
MMMASHLEAIWEDHCAQEFAHKDVAAALRTMTDDPSVNHVPVMTGGRGLDQVTAFYRDHFVGQSPADFALDPVNRVVGETAIVDEFVCRFTHDIVMDWMLPGVPPTNRPVRLAVVAVIGFKGERIAFERVYWDQASLLVQVGLLDPVRLPVTGGEAADKVLGIDQP